MIFSLCFPHKLHVLMTFWITYSKVNIVLHWQTNRLLFLKYVPSLFWEGIRIQTYKPQFLYNNVTSVCIFIGCWPWSIKGHTHTDGVKSTSDHVSRLVFLFSCPQKSFNKPFEFLLYKNYLDYSTGLWEITFEIFCGWNALSLLS